MSATCDSRPWLEIKRKPFEDIASLMPAARSWGVGHLEMSRTETAPPDMLQVARTPGSVLAHAVQRRVHLHSFCVCEAIERRAEAQRRGQDPNSTSVARPAGSARSRPRLGVPNAACIRPRLGGTAGSSHWIHAGRKSAFLSSWLQKEEKRKSVNRSP
jgi:hypothetical protein